MLTGFGDISLKYRPERVAIDQISEKFLLLKLTVFPCETTTLLSLELKNSLYTSCLKIVQKSHLKLSIDCIIII